MARANHRAQIMGALTEHGPMTGAELAEHLGIGLRKVDAAIASARYQSPGQFFRVVRYLPVTGRRGRDLCVFAAEPGEDVPRQKFTKLKEAKRRAQAKARYRDKHRAAVNAANTLRKAALAGRPVTFNPWLQLAAPTERATVSRLTRDAQKGRS